MSEQNEIVIGGLLDALIEAAVDGLIVIDDTGLVQVYSPSCEKYFGYPASEVIGQNVRMLMPAPYKKEHDKYIENYRNTNVPNIIGIGREVTGLRRDGKTFPMHLSIGEYKNGGGSLFVGIVRDLTEIKRAEQNITELQAKLHHAQQFSALNVMASTLAHELNQPLTAIKNYLEVCKELVGSRDEIDGEAILNFLQEAMDQTDRAGQIVQHARQFTEKGVSGRTVEDVNQVVIEACRMILPSIAGRAVNTVMELDENLPAISMNKIQIQQVIHNLIRNAVEAMVDPRQRRLTIGTSIAGADVVEISVSDTGPGLADEITDKIFDPFTTTKADGMGLGLSICRSLIEAHGGQISTTPNDDVGTTFKFTIPAD